MNIFLKLQDSNLKDKQFKASTDDTAGNEIFFPLTSCVSSYLTTKLFSIFLNIYISILNTKLCMTYLFWVFN